MPTRLLLLTAVLSSHVMANAIPCPIDPLLDVSSNWQMTPEAFEKVFSRKDSALFRWLTEDKSRAQLQPKLFNNAVIELSAFDGAIPVQEVIADFDGGKLNLLTISFYNRGDNGSIAGSELKQRFLTAGKAVSNALKVKPQRRTANPNSGLLTEGYSWYSQPSGSALLEHNEGALDGSPPEFLRLRLARPQASGALAASMTHSRGGAAMRLSDLPKHVVKKDNGDTFVDRLPMVHQGDKGYCVAAAVQRLFEYYGIGADMHQIAEIASSDPRRGTNIVVTAKELDKIDYRFKTRLDIIGIGRPMTEAKKKRGEYYIDKPVDEDGFLKAMRSYIDEGLPLLWSLQLGQHPEQPPLRPQTSGGHMRLIIGYNDQTREVLFSDTWGAGHEFKRMNMSHAYDASYGLFALKPTVR